MTYAEWERLSRAFAAFLTADIRSSRATASPSCSRSSGLSVAFLGALRAGLTVVNVNPLYTPRELKEQMSNSGAVAIVIMENFAQLEIGGGREPASARGSGATWRFHAGAKAPAA